MNKHILVFLSLSLISQTILISINKELYLLPMKKSHKYGDDICYYREELDEKRDFMVYYVKPCEKGKYCETAVINSFGFCKDIPTNPIDFPTYEGDCNSNGECHEDLVCESGKCKLKCDDDSLPNPFRYTLDNFVCISSSTKTTDDGIHNKIYKPIFETSGSKYYINSEVTYGKYPGLPKENGIIRYTSITDYYPRTLSAGTYKSYTKWIKESEDWCTIGEAEDGVFVTDKKFCKSGFTLKFFPKGDLVDPSVQEYGYSETQKEMCVTPIQIDNNNPEVDGTIVTYKIKDGDEQKYNYKNYYGTGLDEESVIKSQLYTEFIEEFNNASDEDKKSCYKISLDSPVNMGNCQNIKLIKLYYFYWNIDDYLFYKDRKELEKVLHFKIQNSYPRYYELSAYLNLNYLFLLLILILL